MEITPAEFLYKELEILADKFPGIHIRCGYNAMIRFHVVELLPFEEFKNNDELANDWMSLYFKFVETFNHRNITFISADATLSIGNVLFEFNKP
jgi:hypothetical protein